MTINMKAANNITKVIGITDTMLNGCTFLSKTTSNDVISRTSQGRLGRSDDRENLQHHGHHHQHHAGAADAFFLMNALGVKRHLVDQAGVEGQIAE